MVTDIDMFCAGMLIVIDGELDGSLQLVVAWPVRMRLMGHGLGVKTEDGFLARRGGGFHVGPVFGAVF